MRTRSAAYRARRLIRKAPRKARRDARHTSAPVSIVGKSRARPYVGIKGGKREVFSCADKPTEQSHPQYAAVIGPFKTKRAAEFMAMNGGNNPHIQTVGDAERLCKAA